MGESENKRILWGSIIVIGGYLLFNLNDDNDTGNRSAIDWEDDPDTYFGLLPPWEIKNKAKGFYEILNNNFILFPQDFKNLDSLILSLPTIWDYLKVEKEYGTQGEFYMKDRTLSQWILKAYNSQGEGNIERIKKLVFTTHNYHLPI